MGGQLRKIRRQRDRHWFGDLAPWVQWVRRDGMEKCLIDVWSSPPNRVGERADATRRLQAAARCLEWERLDLAGRAA